MIDHHKKYAYLNSTHIIRREKNHTDSFVNGRGKDDFGFWFDLRYLSSILHSAISFCYKAKSLSLGSPEELWCRLSSSCKRCWYKCAYMPQKKWKSKIPKFMLTTNTQNKLFWLRKKCCKVNIKGVSRSE